MLTPRENFMEVMTGGKPDRFVNQFEFFQMAPGPGMFGPMPERGGKSKDAWGVTTVWPEGVITPYPIHDAEHTVVKDIHHWQDYFIYPKINDNDEDWAEPERIAREIDRNEKFVSTMVFPGFFEMMHYMLGMQEALANYALEPELMHQMIDHYLKYLLMNAEVIAKHVHPDMFGLSDDLGTAVNSFISPAMFKEFFLKPYQTLFGTWRELGVELIYMHNDSYSANLVPLLIESGIQVWQGCVTRCDVPSLVKEFGPQMTFMGDIDSGVVDSPYWTPEIIEREVRRACTTNGKLYFIPCMTMAGPPTLYDGVLECLTENIDKMSKEMF